MHSGVQISHTVYTRQNRLPAGFFAPRLDWGAHIAPDPIHFKGASLREMQRGHFGASRCSIVWSIVRSGGVRAFFSTPPPL